MPLFDREKMAKLVSELRKSVDRLRAIAKLPLTEFLADPDKIGSAKYHFIVAIEACIDMCNHVISRNGYRIPDDYADTFQVMGEVGALAGDFSDELRNMAKFRNRLVHIYWEVDDQQLYEILKTRTDDFKKFLDAMAIFLEWQNLSW
jgi:uncharacterized protein YutE (UPF0331/DUF86 family)